MKETVPAGAGLPGARGHITGVGGGGEQVLQGPGSRDAEEEAALDLAMSTSLGASERVSLLEVGRGEMNHYPSLFSSVQFSRSVVSDSSQPHGPQYARPPCPSPTPRVYSNSYPLSQ